MDVFTASDPETARNSRELQINSVELATPIATDTELAESLMEQSNSIIFSH